MDKKYALKIIEMVGHGINSKDHLTIEACNYLMQLLTRKKKMNKNDDILYEKCYKIKYHQ